MAGWRLENLSEELAAKLDRLLGEAWERVDDEEAAKASVSVAFAVGKDDRGRTVASFKLKHGEDEAGEWKGRARGQGRLSGLEGSLVTLEAGGRRTTVTGEQFARAAEQISLLCDEEAVGAEAS